MGLSTPEGLRVKSGFFQPEDESDEMFWLIHGDTGYGGRCGLLPLARGILPGRVS